MSLPTLPMTYFIVVQAGLAFGLFNALLYGTALCSDLSYLEQGHICRRVGKIRIVLLIHTARSSIGGI